MEKLPHHWEFSVKREQIKSYVLAKLLRIFCEFCIRCCISTTRSKVYEFCRSHVVCLHWPNSSCWWHAKEVVCTISSRIYVTTKLFKLPKSPTSAQTVSQIIHVALINIIYVFTNHPPYRRSRNIYFRNDLCADQDTRQDNSTSLFII